MFYQANLLRANPFFRPLLENCIPIIKPDHHTRCYQESVSSDTVSLSMVLPNHVWVHRAVAHSALWSLFDDSHIVLLLWPRGRGAHTRAPMQKPKHTHTHKEKNHVRGPLGRTEMIRSEQGLVWGQQRRGRQMRVGEVGFSKTMRKNNGVIGCVEEQPVSGLEARLGLVQIGVQVMSI